MSNKLRPITKKCLLFNTYRVREDELPAFYQILELLCQDIYDEVALGLPRKPLAVTNNDVRLVYNRLRADYFNGVWNIEAEIIEE